MKTKLCALFLTVIIVLSAVMTSCTFRNEQTEQTKNSTKIAIKQPNQVFDELLNDVFIATLTSDTLTLHYSLLDPSKFGINKKEIPVTLGSFDYPTEEKIQEQRDLIERLNNINRDELSANRKYDYDILKYDFDLFDDSLEYFYYNDITGQGNIPAMLPVLFAEFDFNSKDDIDIYLELLETAGEYFDSLIRFQQKKVELGLFMNNSSAAEIIQSCKSISEEKNSNIFIKSFENKINKADFLSSDEKNAYFAENKTIFDSVLIPAYETLIEFFENQLTSNSINRSIASLEKGNKYYEYRLKAMGINLSPNELIEICESGLDASYQELLDLYKESEVQNFNGKYMDSLSGEEMLKKLLRDAEDDFPSLVSGVNYRIEKIDESIKDFVSPAFYFLPRIDNYKNNIIYYNYDYSEDYEYMFELMAHEGYPGHMLQLTNFMASPFSNYRKTVNFSAYDEGWTTYIESYIYKYALSNEKLIRYCQVNKDLDNFLTLRVELGVNYQGWSEETVTNYLSSYYIDESFSVLLYDYFKDNPIDILKYIAGYIELTELKENFKNELGSKYSDMLFHQTYLDCGTAPFAVLKTYFDEIIEKTKK